MSFFKAITLGACLMLPFFCVMAYMSMSVYFTDIPSHFQIYYLISAAILLLLIFAFKLPVSLVLPVGFAAGLAFMQIYPYLPVLKAETTENSIKILQANVYYKPDTAAFQRLIENEKPDLIVLAEISSAYTDTLKKMDAYPHQIIKRQISIHSRFPFKENELPAEFNNEDGLIFVEIQADGKKLSFSTMHAKTPVWGSSRRDRQFENTIKAYEKLFNKKPTENFVFAGDINATIYCPAFKKLARKMHVRSARIKRGVMGSWPTWLPAPLRIPIDHVLVSDKIRVLDHRLGPDIGSDHLPTVTVITLK